jgi:hypothetical protein
MNLKEKLEDILLQNRPEPNTGPFQQENTLYGAEQLNLVREILLKDETFKDCNELNFVSFPTIQIGDKPMNMMSYKWTEDFKFKGKCYLLSLSLTPEMYDPNSMTKIVKDGANISPTMYDPITFEPKKKILLEFSMDRPQDGVTNHEEVIRQELHGLLDKVLNDPDTFRIKGVRGLLIRGLFETVETKDTSTTIDLSGEVVEPKYVQVFYMVSENLEGEVKINMKSKFIPNNLKDKFMEQFGKKVSDLSLTSSEIEEFLKNNQ